MIQNIQFLELRIDPLPSNESRSFQKERMRMCYNQRIRIEMNAQKSTNKTQSNE